MHRTFLPGAGKLRPANAIIALVVLAAVVVNGTAGNATVVMVAYLGVLVGASVGAWIGSERAPLGQRLVPRLIAVGISLSALGDVLWSVLDEMGADTDVSIADPPWFVSYIVLCVALWVVLARSSSRRPGRRRVEVISLIDAATVMVVSVLIFWNISVGAIVADHSVPPFDRAVWASYPIADAVLLALVGRVLINRHARAAIGAPFAAGVCLWLAADITYLKTPETGLPGALMDAAWMLGPVLMAGAAWQRSEIHPDTAGSVLKGGSTAQVMVAVGPLFLPTALELANDLQGKPAHPLQLLLGTTVLIALAFVRTAVLIRSEERAHRELEVARDAALDASRAKSMFLTNMSHEIRTPLTTMLASAELLEDTALDDFQHGLVEKMTRTGGLLTTLVEGILDFSRIEAGRLKLTSSRFDLHDMVVDAVEAYAPRAAREGLRLESNVDPSVPECVVGDRARLYQILTNLLDNAVKFTPRGQVRLFVRSTSIDVGTDGASEIVEFVVSDTGIGIPEEDLELVFKSFHQVDGSMTRSYGGNGLGLAICQELTELMGGSIKVQSHPGAGSTFVVRIPVAHSQASRDATILSAV